MRTALAIVPPFIGVPPVLLGTYAIYMGTVVEPHGGPIPIWIGSLGTLIGSGLCLTVYAALRHDKKQAERQRSVLSVSDPRWSERHPPA
jgi:hypothetical protein